MKACCYCRFGIGHSQGTDCGVDWDGLEYQSDSYQKEVREECRKASERADKMTKRRQEEDDKIREIKAKNRNACPYCGLDLGDPDQHDGPSRSEQLDNHMKLSCDSAHAQDYRRAVEDCESRPYGY